ncbi:MAG: (2Fe-2S)-binding protein [Gammaproteobacteria bacterium]
MSLSIRLNGETREVDAEPELPLLWVLRDLLGMTGTKFGCGVGQCGACTVLVEGVPARSCVLPVGDLGTRAVTTIEGLGGDHPVQRAWRTLQVPQCGYCQSGMILSAVALLARTAVPTEAELAAALGNLCRCGTYPRIRRAIALAAGAPAAPT